MVGLLTQPISLEALGMISSMMSRKWTGMMMAMALVGSTALVGCTTGETEESPTPTATPSSAQTLTFKVDVSSMADGTHHLAEVKSGEKVYVVGSFTGWNPNNEEFAMTDEGNGIWSLTLTLPYTGKDYDGNDFMVEPGATLDYKFAKTTSIPDQPWAEGPKDYIPTSEKACPGDNGAGGGLWEIANLSLTVGDASQVLDTVVVDAWRETAESYGYLSCD